ncbi:MAG TPA: hypothetical protein VMW91_00950 [Desulfosporosinus sp.]|nr:hypothetical protein [Desulfosporosinus sp.]
MEWKKIIWALALIVCVPLLINWLVTFPSPKTLAIGSTDAWISYFGSYSGGVIGGAIGGLVAFGVAKYQINNQNTINRKGIEATQIKERNLLRYNQLPSLVKLKFLLEGIYNNLNNALALINQGELDVGDGNKLTLSDQMTLKLNLINPNYLKAIEKMMDVNLQIDLIKLTNFYVDFQETMMIDNRRNQIEFAKFEKELNVKLRIKKQTDANENQIETLRLKLQDIGAELQMNQMRRPGLWTRLKDENYLEKTDLLLKNIENEILEIQNIIS